MVVVFILPNAEFGPYDRVESPHFSLIDVGDDKSWSQFKDLGDVFGMFRIS